MPGSTTTSDEPVRVMFVIRRAGAAGGEIDPRRGSLPDRIVLHANVQRVVKPAASRADSVFLNGLMTTFGAVIPQRAPVASLDDRKHSRQTDVTRRAGDGGTLRAVIAGPTSTAREAPAIGLT
jgi:hypothetical protein